MRPAPATPAPVVAATPTPVVAATPAPVVAVVGLTQRPAGHPDCATDVVLFALRDHFLAGSVRLDGRGKGTVAVVTVVTDFFAAVAGALPLWWQAHCRWQIGGCCRRRDSPAGWAVDCIHACMRH